MISRVFTTLLLGALLICGMATCSMADRTRRWRQSTYDEFLKGTAKGVAVRSDGHLELAPKFTPIAENLLVGPRSAYRPTRSADVRHDDRGARCRRPVRVVC